MNVLQTAAGIVRGKKSKERPEFLVPCLRDFCDFKVPVQQAPFDGKAQKDMKVVGRLVGFYPNTRVVRAIDASQELIEGKTTQGGKDVRRPRQPFLPEGS